MAELMAGQDRDEGVDDLQEELLRVGRHVGHADPLEGDLPVVLEGAGQVTLIPGVHSALRHVGVHHVLVDDGSPSLLVRECSHKLDRQRDTVRERPPSLVGTLVDLIGLGAEEDGTDDHSSFDHEAIDRSVVTEELPAPGSGRVRVSVDRDVVAELVEDGPQVDDLAEVAVDQHHLVDELESLPAQGCAHQVEGRVARFRPQLPGQALPRPRNATTRCANHLTPPPPPLPKLDHGVAHQSPAEAAKGVTGSLAPQGRLRRNGVEGRGDDIAGHGFRRGSPRGHRRRRSHLRARRRLCSRRRGRDARA